MIAALVVVLALVDTPPAHSSARWTVGQGFLLAGAELAIAVDGRLAADGIRRGTTLELNPILGDHPSLEQLALYNVAAMVFVAAIADRLPGSWRTAWLAGVTGFEGALVWHQLRIGLRL